MILKYSKESLCKQMDMVRQALYEVSITLENEERDDEKILNVSKEMDELILEYMKFGKED
nr:aspartyl-phosphate phosphatase Spo0E family protein [Clostridium botulinum]